MSDHFRIATENGVTTITIDRPDALNALSPSMLDELAAAVAAVSGDDKTRAVIITGAGSKAFVAGADISEMKSMNALEGRAQAMRGHRLMSAIEKSPKPFIAAVNGFALGGGCELALACDIRIMADSAKFGQPEIKLGIIPGFGGTQRLARLVGPGIAKEIILTGRMVDADESLRIGLANRVVPGDTLIDESAALAATIAGYGLPALAAAKRAVNEGLSMPLDAANVFEAELFGALFATEDQTEGMTAFLEKRTPEFTDR